jgi:hypothetical protein
MKEESKTVCLALVLLFGGAGIIFILGMLAGQALSEANAPKAEYFLDAEHNKQWRWKPKGGDGE